MSDTVKLDIPPHADVRALCERLWKMHHGLKAIGMEAPVLADADAMLRRMSERLWSADQRGDQ
jgi:hypothetical protein